MRAVLMSCLLALPMVIATSPLLGQERGADEPRSSPLNRDAAIPSLPDQGTLQGTPLLSMPVDCEPGRTCFIQHHVDIDPGPDARDFRCGTATYEGHKGVDIRVLSAAAARQGVSVLAAAPGTVKGVRDGMADAFARETGKAGITDRECGNGMVLDHGNGWETQYCHLRQGSVQVQRGDSVDRGQKLGEVGWSGLADFAHLHLSVRKDGNFVDPFSGRGQENACAREGGDGGLWDDAVARAFPYVNGEILDVGFVEAEPALMALEHDHNNIAAPGPQSAALLLYARAIHVRQGDRIRISIAGPEGFAVKSDGRGIDRSRPLQLAFAGSRLTKSRWPSGRYVGRAELVRDGAVLATRTVEMELP
jgi:murein DD-endopeptidase MepM/ murein hydrolase activator NlpD